MTPWPSDLSAHWWPTHLCPLACSLAHGPATPPAQPTRDQNIGNNPGCFCLTNQPDDSERGNKPQDPAHHRVLTQTLPNVPSFSKSPKPVSENLKHLKITICNSCKTSTLYYWGRAPKLVSLAVPNCLSELPRPQSMQCNNNTLLITW